MQFHAIFGEGSILLTQILGYKETKRNNCKRAE